MILIYIDLNPLQNQLRGEESGPQVTINGTQGKTKAQTRSDSPGLGLSYTGVSLGPEYGVIFSNNRSFRYVGPVHLLVGPGQSLDIAVFTEFW